METIETKHGKYLKFVGDEGQDVIVSTFILPEGDLLGKYVDEESFDLLIEKDTDFYLPPAMGLSVEDDIKEHLNEQNIAFKFRKNVFTKEEQIGAFEGLYGAAAESNNRGLAAGTEARPETSGAREWVTKFQEEVLEYFIKGQPHDLDGNPGLDEIRSKFKTRMQETSTRGSVWVRSQVDKEFDDYEGFFFEAIHRMENMKIIEAKDFARKIKDKMISGTSYATPLWSGIAGFYGRYPRIPFGRPTAFTESHMDDFEKCYPFARKLEKVFANLLPSRHAAQLECAESIDKRYLIGEDTTFTTITVNTTTEKRNARMACHRDAGSLNPGFSNLTVITKDGKDWSNGYLVTPEVRAAINCRPGDLLLIDNMRVIHGNTPIEAPASGPQDMLRMSLVFYFREDMLELGEKEYEDLRRQFVTDRKNNQNHMLWKEYWNGISPGMWSDEEWFQYLEHHGGKEMREKYHPTPEPAPTLDSFF